MRNVSAVPASTYRLQLSAEFTLQDAAGVVPYLHELGVDWLYLSPLLEAESGSTHGYDVVDHRRVDAARGGEHGLRMLADAAHRLGMGVLVDIVPNHVGVATPHANAWWWDVLSNGRASRYAAYFDIDWDAGGGRLRVPVLADAADELDRLAIDGEQLVYYDSRFPIAAGTSGGTAREVHDRQHYELVSWRRADHELNYRRFFAVNTLAGIRVEDGRVFDDSHVEIARWVAEGLVDGLRIDHPDGLRDPGGYLHRLRALAGERPIWIEKILEGPERIPDDWPVAGTTGYDALALVDRVFVDPLGEQPLRALGARAAGGEAVEWAELVRSRKRSVARGILGSEIHRVARELANSTPDDPHAVDDALVEVAAAMPVYRSYLPFGREHLARAAADAAAATPALASTVERVCAVLADPRHPAALRFQQITGMIMAKGVEDSAFYRYPGLSSLAEVGGAPSAFAISPSDFHAAQRDRLERLPASMTTLTTHDTKRSEDARARIAVIGETPERWDKLLAGLRSIVTTGDEVLEGLVWQAVVGAWPASRERLEAYALKAAREAGASTSWTDGDAGFEARLKNLVDAAFDDEGARGLIESFVAGVTPAGHSNGLGMKLLQLLAPGVPDVYQGTELWDRSLVDPDNRRPVGFDAAVSLLQRIDEGWLPPVDDTGAAKLLLVSRALRLRRDRPGLLAGYEPVAAVGPAAEHLIGFDRGSAIALATRLPLGLAEKGGWRETSVDLGGRMLRDELTGRRARGVVRVAELFGDYPVALLVEAS